MAKSASKSAGKSSDREARLAAALRANLKRRKAQSRTKDATTGPDPIGSEANKPHPGPNMAQKAD